MICWLFGHKLKSKEQHGYNILQCERCYKYFDTHLNEINYIEYSEKKEKEFHKLERPNEKWNYYFKKVRGNPYIPAWYKCPKCGVEYQSSPPTMDTSGMYKKCPECI